MTKPPDESARHLVEVYRATGSPLARPRRADALLRILARGYELRSVGTVALEVRPHCAGVGMPGDEACAMLFSVLAAAFTLMSSQFVAAGPLPATASWNHDGCTGTNRSPALHWISPPVRAKAFALSVYDPDAGSAGWWHWIVYDIPIQQHGFATALSATAPHVKQGINDFGMVGYGGPCPPPGPAHHYVFTLYALNVAHLYASSRLRGSAFMQLIRPHIVGTATLTGIYSR